MSRRGMPAGQRRMSLQAALVMIVVLLGIFFFQEFTGTEESETPTSPRQTSQPGTGGQSGNGDQQETTPQPGDLQIFFTTPTLVYPDKAAQRPESPLLQAAVEDIDAARSSVDLAVFDLDVPEIGDALIRAKKRGVAVRVIVDDENLETPEVAELTGELKRAGIKVIFDEREPFMHNKFLVVDQAIAWTGSWNITTNDTYRNNNNMVRMPNKQIAAYYTTEFEQMYKGVFGSKKRSTAPHPVQQIGSSRITVLFSPEDGVAEYVLQRLKAARTSIRFMAFSFTSDPIAQQLIDKVGTGVSVQGVFERQNANGTGADFKMMQDGNVDVLVDGSCYIMHHKTIIIDEKIVITGSYNFTKSAEKDNDENLIIIEDPAVARIYLEEFQRLFKQAQSPTRCG